MMSEVSADWEKRDASTPFSVHMVAGCLAGIAEHISMLPFDNVKTRLQVLPDQNFFQVIKDLKSNGVRSYFTGINAVTAGCMPAHALYFSAYEFMKTYLQVDDEDHHPLQFAFIGAFSTLWHDLIMTPFDVIKQRQQITQNPFIQSVRNILSTQGLFQLFRSFPVTYFMAAPNQAIIISANETLKIFTAQKEHHTFTSYFLCAGIAGSVAAIATNPLDVIKTKLQTQNCHLSSPIIKYKDIHTTFQIILREEQFRGFYKGLVPRMCMQTPSSAIAWASYEMLKKWLLKQKE